MLLLMFSIFNVFIKYYIDGYEDKKIDIIYANVYDIKTVMIMAQKTSVVINCTSPYYIYGEVVVKSCVLTSTHYVDVTGEPLVSDVVMYRLLNLDKLLFLYRNSKVSIIFFFFLCLYF
jgi:hypothetical protein